MTVMRRLSADELGEGLLRLGPQEARSLDMPEFSGHVDIRFQGSVSSATWDARARTLRSESLLEELSLEARVSDQVRWTRDQDVLVLEAIGQWEPVHRPSAFPRSGDPFASDPFAPVAPGQSPLTGASHRRVRRARTTRQRTMNVESDYQWRRPTIGILDASLKQIRHALATKGWDDVAAFRLRIRGEELTTVNDFEELVAADSARIDPMEHQYAAALKALGVMRGRAILADEVGLGKTIEAGLVASELMVRGLATRFLVITPATLRDQWRRELDEKFSIQARVVASGQEPLDRDSLIMSLQLAMRNRALLHPQHWDVVIVDEAHRVAGPGARVSRELMQGLNSRYVLFLTATPVQNDLRELYRLVELLRPGTFVSQRQFERQYIDGHDPRRPRNPEDLRRLVSNVMIRTTRAQAGLDRVKRNVADHPIALSPTEQKSYELVVRILREVLTGPGDHLRRDSLARALTLSPRGLYESARKAAEAHRNPLARSVLEELADLAADHGPTERQRALLARVREWTTDSDKGRVIVFTQQTRVLTDLVRVLDEAGIEAAAYHGGMSAGAKQDSLDRFRSSTRVLVSTESGAEGLNLQHANAVINYDLPWNPMRIEQRVGRVHRVTQTRDVFVSNMFALGTVDEHVYKILVEKLRMFELLFGQITTILGEMEEGSSRSQNFESQVKDALYAANDKEMHRRLKALSQRAGAASQRARQQMRDSGGVSSWMSPTLDHRAAIRREAEELKPEFSVRKRERQRAVERFSRDWLNHHGCTIVHETTDFIAAQVPPRLQQELGTDTLYLAFTPEGVSEHPGAEMVAVGSPLFDDLVSSSKETGDLLGWTIRVPDLADLDSYPPIPSPHGATFVERRNASPTAVGASGTWRVSDEGTRFGDEIITTRWGDFSIVEGVHHPVSPDVGADWLDEYLNSSPEAFVDSVTKASLDGIAVVRSKWQSSLAAAFGEELKRRKAQVRDRLDETWHAGTRKKIERELRDLAQERPPQVRVRAELLAVEVVSGSSVAVTEVWSHPDGRRVEVEGSWDAATDQITLFGANGQPIGVMAVCEQLHATDVSRLSVCPQCGDSSCSSCQPRFRPERPCGVCGRLVCGACLPGGRVCAVCDRPACDGCWTGDTCSTCAMPDELAPEDFEERLPAALLPDGLAVRYGTDDSLTVVALVGGHRREVAVLDRDRRLLHWWTLADSNPPLLSEALAAARACGAHGDLHPNEAEEATPSPPDDPELGLLLQDATTADTHWVIGDHTVPLSAVRVDTSTLQPTAPDNERRHHALLAALPPPNGRSTPAQRRTVHHHTLTWLDRQGLHTWTADGATTHTTHAEWTAPDPTTLDQLHQLTHTWDQQPTPHTSTTLSTTTALLTTLGPYRLLHLLPSGEPPDTWVTYDVDGMASETALLANGLALFNDWIPTEVLSSVGPGASLPTVSSREGVARITGRVWVVDTRPDASTVDPAALRDLGPESPPLPASMRLTRLDPLPATQNHRQVLDLVDELVGRRPPVGRVAVQVGIRCRCAVVVGQDLVHADYVIFANDLPGTVRDLRTGARVTDPAICDEAHLSPQVWFCMYCHRRSCSDCIRQVRGCTVCGQGMCSTCVPDASLCPACVDLHRPGWLRRRALTRDYPGCQGVLMGRDSTHEVVLLNFGHSVRRVVTVGQRMIPTDIPATPELTRLFNTGR